MSAGLPPERRVSDAYRSPVEVDAPVSPKATSRHVLEALGAFVSYVVFTHATDPDPFLPEGRYGTFARLFIAVTSAVMAACLVPLLLVVPLTCLWRTQRTWRAIVRNFGITMLVLFGLQVTDRILKVASDGKRGLNAVLGTED